ncbi:alpha/beta fold hydrolase, partial [Mycoplasmopsis synoviae]|uniref:alpha/beta fold hydrolase n=1 Tax=Mycoplasmopsis synoviae TaxID=2109 RepID=UPI00387B049D
KNLYYDPSFINDSSWLKEQEKLFNSQDYNNETITKLGKSLPDINLHNDIANAHLEIKVPSLLVLGEKDGVIDRDLYLSYFKKQVKNIKTCWIPKTGHMMFNENFPAFIKIVEDFILD